MFFRLQLISLAVLINVPLFATYLADNYRPPPQNPSPNPSGGQNAGSKNNLNGRQPQKPREKTPVPSTGSVTLGPKCTRIGRRCVSTAKCLYHKRHCQCPPHLPVGDGLMECTKQGNLICSVDCDPKVLTWRGDRAPVNLPCWYTVSLFRSPIHPQPRQSVFKWCQVHVKALNSLTEDGLFFVGTVVVSVWVAGLGSNGFYLHGKSMRRFEVNVDRCRRSIQKRKDPWRVWEKVAHFWTEPQVKNALGGKLPVLTSWEPADRFAVLRIPQCGVQVKYRPFGDLQPQSMKPGLVITLASKDKDLKFPGSRNLSTVCLSPRTTTTFRQAARRYRLSSPAHFLLLLVLMQKNLLYSNPAKNPDFHEQCTNARQCVQDKTCHAGRYLAIKLCSPLLSVRHRFVKCLGRKLVMKVFEKCIYWACLGNVEGTEKYCDWFHRALQDKGCTPTRLMTAIGCHDDKRQHYMNRVFKPATSIPQLLG